MAAIRKYAVCARGVLGVFSQNAVGWRFLPWVQRSPSRKDWPTAEAALPRWAGDARIIEAETPEAAVAIYTQRTGRPL